MKIILQFIIKHCDSLYNKFGFRFVDSKTSSSFGGDSLLVLSNDIVKLKFVYDRGQLFLDFNSCYDKNKNNWYSFDLIRQLVTGEEGYYSIMDNKNGKFLQRNIDQIMGMFAKPEIEYTLTKLKSLQEIRVKRRLK